MQTIEKRPFHESIIDVIRQSTIDELACLASLIKATEIRENHDQIIDAWSDRIKRSVYFEKQDFGVIDSLFRQKVWFESDEYLSKTNTYLESEH